MDKISGRNWALVWILGMVGQLCWNIENSVFNVFVYNKITPDASIVSWMVGVSATVTTFSTFLFGTLSDRAGRRRPFIGIGYILWGIFTIVFGLGQYIPKDPIWLAASFVVLADAVMTFFGSMGNDGGFNAWTTDISSARNRGRLGGALAVMPVLATIIGTLGSGALIQIFDFFAYFTAIGVIVALIGVWTLFTLREAPDFKPTRDPRGFWRQFLSVFSFKSFTGNMELFWVFIVMAVYFIGFNVYFPYISIYFVNTLSMSYSDAGIVQGVGLLAAALLTIPAARIIDRGRVPLVITIAIAANTLGLMTVGISDNFYILLAGVFGAGVGYILTLQALLAWIKNLYPEGQRGQFEGVKQIFFVAIPMIIGPWIGTLLINRYGVERIIEGNTGMAPTPILFWVSAALTLLTLLPLVAAARRMRRRQAAEA